MNAAFRERVKRRKNTDGREGTPIRERKISNLNRKYCSRYYDHIKSKLNVNSISLFLQVCYSDKTKKIPRLLARSSSELISLFNVHTVADHFAIAYNVCTFSYVVLVLILRVINSYTLYKNQRPRDDHRAIVCPSCSQGIVYVITLDQFFSLSFPFLSRKK